MRLVRMSVVTVLVLVGGVALGVGTASAAEEPCPAGFPYGRPGGTPPNQISTNDGAYEDPPLPSNSPANCRTNTTSTAVYRGESFAVGGSGYKPGAPVNVALSGRSVGTATADGNGSFTKTVVAPADFVTGNHAISATGMGKFNSARELVGDIRILETAAGPKAGSAKIPAAKPAVDSAVGSLPSGAGLAAPAVTPVAGGAAPASATELAAAVPQPKLAGSEGSKASPLAATAGAAALLGAGGLATAVARKRKAAAKA